ncbi:hypothetical protein Y032_0183g924 [Ancylostoma ceylanicum]|uniref:Uncharacterized protein n=1 Tax=Ancylostoma ceylanicum TaxID=53326 RepID=A0A016SRZ9_9BILA|nr:hypothetical protein Y032_0183g924 [Ancylostoma ceylanicum]
MPRFEESRTWNIIDVLRFLPDFDRSSGFLMVLHMMLMLPKLPTMIKKIEIVISQYLFISPRLGITCTEYVYVVCFVSQTDMRRKNLKQKREEFSWLLSWPK